MIVTRGLGRDGTQNTLLASFGFGIVEAAAEVLEKLQTTLGQGAVQV